MGTLEVVFIIILFFLFIFKTRFHVAQMGLDLSVLQRVTELLILLPLPFKC